MEKQKENCRVNRIKILEDMVKQKEKRTGQDAKTINDVKAILNSERSQQHHAVLRRYNHPATHGSRKLEALSGCKHVDEMWEILKEEGRAIDKIKWKTVPSGQETTDFLLRWCVRHFGQATDTPMATRSWKNRLDPRKAENILQEIINRTFKMPRECPNEMIQFLQAAKSPKGAKKTPFMMTFAHFINFCQKQDERQGSSP